MCELGCPGAVLRSATWVEAQGWGDPGGGGRKTPGKVLTPESRERVHRCSLNGIATFRMSETFHDKMWGGEMHTSPATPSPVPVAARSSPYSEVSQALPEMVDGGQSGVYLSLLLVPPWGRPCCLWAALPTAAGVGPPAWTPVGPLGQAAPTPCRRNSPGGQRW